MKNLLLYINIFGKFDDETSVLVKIQIDNSFDLGWEKEDILLFTNFEFEYRGVKAVVIPTYVRCELDATSNKVPIIIYLIRNKLLQDDELYWYHDFDAYENSKIVEAELEMGDYDLALCSYLYKNEWQLGSFFFKTSALDIFEDLNNRIIKRNRGFRADEKEFWDIVNDHVFDGRWKELNVTYNITMRYTYFTYHKADKPLRVLHFHPYYYDTRLPDPLLDNFMYGKSRRLRMPLMSERLISIFHQQGVK